MALLHVHDPPPRPAFASRAHADFGPDGIAEYLAFATSDSPYFAENFNYPLSLTSFRPRGGWDEDAGECVITVALWSRYSMSDITVPKRTVTFAGMMKLYFSLVDTDAKIAIRRIKMPTTSPSPSGCRPSGRR